MARVLLTGFELKDNSSTDPAGPDGNCQNGTFNTTTRKSGAVSLSLGSTNTWAITIPGTLTDAYLKFDFYKTTNPGSAEIIANLSGGGTLRLESDGTLRVYNSSSVAQGSASAAASNSVWNRVEIRQYQSTQQYCSVRLNGTEFATGLQTHTTTAPINTFTIRGPGVTLLVDDFALNSTSGSANNSWVGDEKIVLLIPTGDNSRTEWYTSGTGPPSGTSNLYLAVRNTPPVGALTGADNGRIESINDNLANSYTTNLTTLSAAGLVSGDTLKASIAWLNHGEEVATGTKAGQFYAVDGLLDQTVISFNYGDDAGIIGTYPSGWKWKSNTVYDSPSLALTTVPRLVINRETSVTRVATVDFMGAYVAYTPASGTTYQQQCLASGTGTASLTKANIYSKALYATAVGTVALTKMITKVLAAAATGAATLIKSIYKAFAATATGTATLAVGRLLLQQCYAAATGTATLAKALTWSLQALASGTGTVSLAKMVTKVLTASGTGTVSTIKMITLGLSAAATGTAALARTITKVLQAAATGTVSASQTLVSVVVQQCYAAGTGTVTLLKTITKGLSTTGTGTPALARNIALAFSVAVTGTASLVKTVGKVLSTAATGTVSASQTLITYVVQQCYAAGTGTVSLAKTVTKVLATSATGTASLAKSITKVLAAAATGTASLAKVVLYVAVYAVSATGAVSLVKMISKTFQAAGTGTASVIRKIAKTLTVNATGSVTEADSYQTTRSASTTGTGTVSASQTYIPGGGVVEVLRAIRRAMLRYIRRR